jgi:hypothetical protein
VLSAIAAWCGCAAAVTLAAAGASCTTPQQAMEGVTACRLAVEQCSEGALACAVPQGASGAQRLIAWGA